ncbi:Kinesin- motor protein [Batrachochytrium dendrobatidis]
MSASESKETNITVVVRIRPRNQKDIRENSPICISTTSNKKELQLRLHPAVFSGSSSAAHASDSVTTKSFHFDRVFGPEVSQQELFDEVASGILSEVLMGYNCTIFAYGQTGTGKTHTMEGDLAVQGSPDAGIIPRTLYSLFDTLERETAEYSVRVSFIELYNEEINDLLSPEDDNRKLKIFDDRKGSTLIQGLEEILVKNAADVISILQTGSNRRQKAATKLNHVSSRSHGIFSITVHTKECTPDGEELLKVGKLNLVDLAGSENIGRSGAENKRAKEAGMINQSLLTLGRVIGALVEHNSHIPYRESKLTRILQDSLGGRTKTCIIAAVSPAKCNIEESHSTLDYAHRAKNIRNKPEINQRMTKKALLREYITEIERLKSDLTATREKNGIYISKEGYTSMLEESQSRKDRIDEVTNAIILKETQIAALELQFNQNIQILNQTSHQLTETMNELNERKVELGVALENIELARRSLVQQEFLTRAHANTEVHLDSLAESLVSTLVSSTNDVQQLHDKLDRKRTLDHNNASIFLSFQDKIGGYIDDMLVRMNQFDQLSKACHHDITANIHASVEQSSKMVLNAKNLIDGAVSSMGNFGNLILKENAEIANESALAIANISQAAQSLSSALDNQNEKLLTAIESISTNIERQLSEQATKMGQARAMFEQHLNMFAQTINSDIQRDLTERDSKHEALQSLLKEQIKYLCEYNSRLEKQLLDDNQTMVSAKEQLIQKFVQELDGFTTLSNSRRQAFAQEFSSHTLVHSSSLEAVHEKMATDYQDSRVRMQNVNHQFQAGVSTALSGCNNMNQLAEQQHTDLVDSNHTALVAVREAAMLTKSMVENQLASTFDITQKEFQHISQHADEQKIILKEQKHIIESLPEDFEIQTNFETAELNSRLDAVQNLANSHLLEVDSISKDCQEVRTIIKNQIEESQLLPDTSTGKTPRRRAIKFPTSWKRTRDHDDLLQEFNARLKTGDTDNMEFTSITKSGNFTSAIPPPSSVSGQAAEAAEYTSISGESHLMLYQDDNSYPVVSNFSPDLFCMDYEFPPTPGPASKLPRSRPKRYNVTFNDQD